MAIRFLRGSGHSSSTTVSLGQPYFDYTNNALYIGNNMDESLAISSLTPVNVPWYQTFWMQAGSYNNFMVSFFTHDVYNSISYIYGSTSGYWSYDHQNEYLLATGKYYDADNGHKGVAAIYLYSYTKVYMYSYYLADTDYRIQYTTVSLSSYYATTNILGAHRIFEY